MKNLILFVVLVLTPILASATDFISDPLNAAISEQTMNGLNEEQVRTINRNEYLFNVKKNQGKKDSDLNLKQIK